MCFDELVEARRGHRSRTWRPAAEPPNGPVTTSTSPGTAPARPGTRSLVPKAVTDEEPGRSAGGVSPGDRHARLVQTLVELDHLLDLGIRGRAEADEQPSGSAPIAAEVAQVDRSGLVAEVAPGRPVEAEVDPLDEHVLGRPRRPPPRMAPSASWPAPGRAARAPAGARAHRLRTASRFKTSTGPEPAPMPVRPACTASEAMRAAPACRILEALAAGEEGRQARRVRATGAVGRVRRRGARPKSARAARRRRASPPPRSPWPPVTITAGSAERVDAPRRAPRGRASSEYGTPASAQASCRFGVTTVASGKQPAHEHLHRVVLEELRAGGGDHHRVDDERHRVAGEEVGDGLDDPLR